MCCRRPILYWHSWHALGRGDGCWYCIPWKLPQPLGKSDIQPLIWLLSKGYIVVNFIKHSTLTFRFPFLWSIHLYSRAQMATGQCRQTRIFFKVDMKDLPVLCDITYEEHITENKPIWLPEPSSRPGWQEPIPQPSLAFVPAWVSNLFIVIFWVFQFWKIIEHVHPKQHLVSHA